jgi:hypothetical protein
LQKKHETAIATKKTVAKHTGKKCVCKKQVQKKTPCHDTVRLRLGWWLQPGEYTRDCNILYMWLQTADVQQLQKHDSCDTRMWVIACTLIAV